MPDPLLPPDYIADLYGQLASIAVVLGGFAVAALNLLPRSDSEKRIASWAAGTAALSAAALISTAILSVIVSAHAGRGDVAASGELTSSATALLTLLSGLFPLGLYALLFSIASCGWIRSRETGWATTAAALVGAVGVTAGLLVIL